MKILVSAKIMSVLRDLLPALSEIPWNSVECGFLFHHGYFQFVGGMGLGYTQQDSGITPALFSGFISGEDQGTICVVGHQTQVSCMHSNLYYFSSLLPICFCFGWCSVLTPYSMLRIILDRLRRPYEGISDLPSLAMCKARPYSLSYLSKFLLQHFTVKI